MSQYNILQAIFMSFYSRKLYRDVAFNWGGKTILYLLLVLALSWISLTYQMQQNINEHYTESFNQFVNQFPVMTVQDGKISTPENRPYYIVDSHQNNIVVIDTIGKYTTLEQAQTDILVTKSQVISRPKSNEMRVYDIPPNTNMVLDPQILIKFVANYHGYVWIFIFLAFLFASFIYRLLQAFLYSIIGKLFSLIFKTGVTYGQIMQIDMVAITPAIVIATIFDYCNYHPSHELLFYFILSIIYIFYGIIASKRSATS